jgi:hypothetical protein
VTKPSQVANDFGGSVGGPGVIPHLYNGKNKSFFYGDYEGFRLPRTSTIENTVPTAAMRQGDFGFLCTQSNGTFNGAGVCSDSANQLYSPYDGTPYANNVITGISPGAAAFLGFYPNPKVGTAFTTNNYRTNVPANLSSNGFDVRGDQYFGEKLFVTGRYTFKNIPNLSPTELSIPSNTQYEHVRMLVASGTYAFKPTVLNEFRFGLTDDLTGQTNPYNGRPFTESLGFDNINNLWFNGLPEVDFNGSSGTTGLTVDRLNSTGQSRTYEFADNLSWVVGRHNFKFGMDAQKLRAVSALGFFGANNYGTYGFNGMFTGNDFADFLIGAPSESDLDNVQLDNDGRNYKLSFFGQDSIRATKRLTLELGVRFEYHPGYSDASGQIGNFIQTPRSGGVVYPDGSANLLATSFLQSFDACPTPGLPGLAGDPTSANGAPCTPVLTASQAGIPQGLRATSKVALPRFGFAYKLTNDDKTVIRGGIGSYNASTLGSVYYSLTGTLQAYTNQYFNTQTPGVGPAFVWPQTSFGSAGVAPYGSAYFGTANSIAWKEPYSLQWNLSLERDLGHGTGLRLTYIGMKTTNLVWAPNFNQSLPSTIPYSEQPLSSRPYPNWGVVNTRANGATATNNQAQVEVTHRFGAGLSFDSTYTWSRNLADNQGAGNAGSLCGETACNRSQDFYNRRSEKGNTFAPYVNNWVSTVVYQLPFGTGKRFANTSKILNGVIGGWQTNNILRLHSGPYLTPYFNSGDPSGTGSGIIGRSQRPDRVGNFNPAQKTAGEWINGAGFACPGGSCSIGEGGSTPAPIGRFGTSGVGILTGPGTIDWDSGLSKSFNLTERAKLQFEFSFVNVLNHLNLGTPNLNITNINNPSTGLCGFGCISSA